jgi:hypothetical protein
MIRRFLPFAIFLSAAAAQVWPDACAIVLTDDWAPVDRLISGRSVCGRVTER